jgi:hypothetical protein
LFSQFFLLHLSWRRTTKSVNDHDLVNINDLRKSKSLKAQSKVKQLLKINDSSSDDESVESNSDSEVSDDNTKKSKKQKVRKNLNNNVRYRKFITFGLLCLSL